MPIGGSSDRNPVAGGGGGTMVDRRLVIAEDSDVKDGKGESISSKVSFNDGGFCASTWFQLVNIYERVKKLTSAAWTFPSSSETHARLSSLAASETYPSHCSSDELGPSFSSAHAGIP